MKVNVKSIALENNVNQNTYYLLAKAKLKRGKILNAKSFALEAKRLAFISGNQKQINGSINLLREINEIIDNKTKLMFA